MVMFLVHSGGLSLDLFSEKSISMNFEGSKCELWSFDH